MTRASADEAPVWQAGCPDELRPVVEACASGALPPNVALLRLAMAARGPEEVEGALEGARAGAPAPEAGRLGEALRLWRGNPKAFATVRSVLAGVAHDGPSPEDGPAHWARIFDRLSERAPEAGVALYALGNADLLRAATAEVVDWLAAQGLLGLGREVLEIGCGQGRFVAAIAPRVRWITGLDISAGMIARARETCAGLCNVALAVGNGCDLGGVTDGSVDLVLAADVFPYLVQTGEAVLRRHVEEVARVLRPGGTLAVLNHSYRSDPERDRAELAALGAGAGLGLSRVGRGDFALWDAPSFLLRKD
ncbi:class I SAM-dependent methyltransferase [Rubellimicrobium roseum]|uniref:Methyltransferase domain-containing protein n=1 Tax=Rubellimicrobium roseum TaxID=687525 RepID=A0A5C4N8M8_9RHOB|nr:class I SAM-dependent methyltransferase [Rubellimicrobium roseum]TNC70905.1 methyltransferase domain-containing protein [Rubellimicrobium roseum]